MNNTTNIISMADTLVRRYGTRNSELIARELGVEIRYYNDIGKIKGMYTVMNRTRYIILNASLSEEIMSIVCAHELGHDRLHRNMVKNGTLFRDFALYDMKSRSEYEANLFASQILIADDEVVEYAESGYDVEQIAKAVGTDINLMSLKVNQMINRGFDLRAQVFKNNFLK